MSQKTHIVLRGDTVNKLAQYYQVEALAILHLNNLTFDDRLVQGSHISIPSKAKKYSLNNTDENVKSLTLDTKIKETLARNNSIQHAQYHTVYTSTNVATSTSAVTTARAVTETAVMAQTIAAAATVVNTTVVGIDLT